MGDIILGAGIMLVGILIGWVFGQSGPQNVNND